MRTIALAAVACLSAVPSLAMFPDPIFGREASEAVAQLTDSRTYRVTALRQRIWALEDAKRRQWAELSAAAVEIRFQVKAGYLPMLNVGGWNFESSETVAEEVRAWTPAAFSRAIANLPEDHRPGVMAAFKAALAARVQLDSIESELAKLRAELGAASR